MSTVYLLCTIPALEEQNLEQRIICPRCLLHEERDALPGNCNKVRPSAPIIHRGRSNLLNKPWLNNVLAQFVERESGREYAMTTPPVVLQMWDNGGWERTATPPPGQPPGKAGYSGFRQFRPDQSRIVERLAIFWVRVCALWSTSTKLGTESEMVEEVKKKLDLQGEGRGNVVKIP